MKPPTPHPKPPMDGTWIIPYDWMMLADGTFVLRPKKPVQVMNAREAARFTGLSKKTLARLAESGFISVEWPTPRMPRYYPGEVLASQKPGFFSGNSSQKPGFFSGNSLAASEGARSQG